MEIKKLSEVQQNTLTKMKYDHWYSAYDLGVSIATLNALHRMNLLAKQSGVGEFIVRFRKVSKNENQFPRY